MPTMPATVQPASGIRFANFRPCCDDPRLHATSGNRKDAKTDPFVIPQIKTLQPPARYVLPRTHVTVGDQGSVTCLVSEGSLPVPGLPRGGKKAFASNEAGFRREMEGFKGEARAGGVPYSQRDTNETILRPPGDTSVSNEFPRIPARLAGASSHSMARCHSVRALSTSRHLKASSDVGTKFGRIRVAEEFSARTELVRPPGASRNTSLFMSTQGHDR